MGLTKGVSFAAVVGNDRIERAIQRLKDYHPSRRTRCWIQQTSANRYRVPSYRTPDLFADWVHIPNADTDSAVEEVDYIVEMYQKVVEMVLKKCEVVMVGEGRWKRKYGLTAHRHRKII
jgi:hypothetical protein